VPLVPAPADPVSRQASTRGWKIAGTPLNEMASRTMADGHLAHALGQQRHFEMNEAFHNALLAADVQPDWDVGVEEPLTAADSAALQQASCAAGGQQSSSRLQCSNSQTCD
jgi:hypothetical protein